MENLFTHFDLTEFPQIDRKEEIIETQKKVKKILKDSRNQAKKKTCYYCGKPCDGFCNSHTVPAFCLKNIADKGKVYYANTIIDLPILKADNIINNIYNKDPKYVIRNISLCIFPLEKNSIIMLFVDKYNRRYSKFFKQLQRCKNTEEELAIINYILFSYCEDYFISPKVEKDILEKLKRLMGKTSSMLSDMPTTIDEQLEAIKKVYNFSERNIVPNLLSKEYAITVEN